MARGDCTPLHSLALSHLSSPFRLGWLVLRFRRAQHNSRVELDKWQQIGSRSHDPSTAM